MDAGGRSFLRPALGMDTPHARRRCYFGRERGSVDTAVLSRAALSPEPIAGPLVIEDYDATTVVPPGWLAHLDDNGSIVMDADSTPLTQALEAATHLHSGAGNRQ